MSGNTEQEKDYEVAIKAFEEAEKVWQTAEEYVSSGKFIYDVMNHSKGSVTKATDEWNAIWRDLRLKQEDYNAKRKNAADALRQAVSLSPNQWRGPEGKPTVLTHGEFKATSVTRRSFDAKSLRDLVNKHGLLDRLLTVTTIDKDGKEAHIFEPTWAIDYNGVLSWLRANKLDDVVTGAYDEKESTPQVKGPKEVYFMGDRKKD